jgi:hypothetical protein
MKALTNFIIRPKDGVKFRNEVECNGVNIIINASEDERLYANREAIVVNVPHGYKGDVEVGADIIVHHNTFIPYYNMQGRFQNSSMHVMEDLYQVEPDGFFLYKKGGEWIANDRYCFVKPVPAFNSLLIKGVSDEPLVGEITYPNKYLCSLGLKKKDIIVFTPDSEYEFKIDGEKMYRVFDHQITLQLND